MRHHLIRYLRGLTQLSRPDPTISWAVGAFAIGAALAYHHVGTALLWKNGAIALVGVISAIAFGAHGLNDVYDWYTGTDKASIGKGTGGSRVIPEGLLSLRETAAMGVGGLGITLFVGVHLYFTYGWPIIVLTAVAVGAPVAYSLPPFKLAYRPFPELVVVVPALTGVTIGSELVLSGTMTWTGFLAGLVHAAFSISWYVVSRVPDYRPDKRVGKRTTVVYLGRETAPLLSAVYLVGGVAISLFGLVHFGWPFVVTPVFGVLLLLGLVNLDPFDPEAASVKRYRQMRLSTAHAFVLAMAIVVGA